MQGVAPFRIEVPESEIERLRSKLRDTRLPASEVVPGANDDYGIRPEWVQRMHKKWIEDFDFEKHAQEMNSYHHYKTKIEDINLHFVHEPAGNPDAIPLLLVHGWPGSFYEFHRLIHPFSRPESSEQAAFHVVVPSLPGFCFSSGPNRRGWTMKDNARIFDKLMKRLGYEKYVIQTGDWGHWVGRELGVNYTDSCQAVHFNYCPSGPPVDMESYTPEEMDLKNRSQDFLLNHIGYAVVMRTRPQTIGIALYDNPIGILVWMGEKYLEAADPVKRTAASWEDTILVTCSLYYFTYCAITACLPYYENVYHHNFTPETHKPENYIKIPMAFSSFLYDTQPASERGARQTGKLVQYRHHKRGGHFAALESPEDLLKDCRDFLPRYFHANSHQQ